ncbi:protein kinase [Roseibaca sp. V10]|uniref:Protein kinase n=1 Tax=Roseinatronobacter domitianus TaxID=2940293 RepID=A0ABT0M2U6_9RHOB|nr:serine/threonine-protein kinase [Roseibaca domitiana]MCL1629176.1 protein kinase [Roseibaca domitiana]
MASMPPEDPPETPGPTPPQSPRRNTYVTRSPIQLSAGTLLIGTYELQEHINTGGMGEVYRGVNIHNDEVVAIKIVLPALAHDEKILSLFQKESTVLRRISHDAIVRYEVFTIDPDIARPCLVMEYVDGPSLNDMMDLGPMPTADVLRLLRRLAEGLDVAHRAGVVHRDLSPDNVILPDRSVLRAKIIDFGIAKATTPGGRTLIGGQFAGKPGYVAPEQLGLYDGVVSGQADIYSLGLMAAATAMGRPIDMGDSPAAAVLARATVPDLSALPEDLRPLFNWMLQPDPAERPASMADVIDYLDSLAPVAPMRSQPPGSQPPRSMPPASAPPVATPEPSAAPSGVAQSTSAELGSSPFGPAPTHAAPSRPPSPAPAKGKGGMIGIVAAIAVALGAGGAWYAGILGGGPGAPVSEAAISTSPTPEPPAPLDVAAARAWLNSQSPTLGACHWLPRLREADGVDGLTAYASTARDLEAMRSAFADRFGQTLDLRMVAVSAQQCATLDALAALDARRSLDGSADLQIRGLPDSLPADAQALSGQLAPARDAAFFMIDPSGQIQNIAASLTEAGTFEISQTRLRRLGAAPDGTGAPALMVLALHGAGTDSIRRLIPENAILPSAQAGDFWTFLVQALDQPDKSLSIGVKTVLLP